MKRNTWIFYDKKLSVQREKMGILSIKKTSDFMNLSQNVLECSISRIVYRVYQNYRPPMSFAEKLILYFQKRSFCLNHMSV